MTINDGRTNRRAAGAQRNQDSSATRSSDGHPAHDPPGGSAQPREARAQLDEASTAPRPTQPGAPSSTAPWRDRPGASRRCRAPPRMEALPMAHKALGRGLDALLKPATPPAPTPDRRTPTARPRSPSTRQPQPRPAARALAEEALRELADSIKIHGLAQAAAGVPLRVPANTMLVAGERRLRAAKLAGWPKCPASSGRQRAGKARAFADREPSAPGPERHRRGGVHPQAHGGIFPHAGGVAKALGAAVRRWRTS